MNKSNSGPCPYPDETCNPSCRQCIERAKPKVKTCEWKLWDNGKGWCTACLRRPTKQDHPVAHSLYILCPFCGGVIKEIE